MKILYIVPYAPSRIRVRPYELIRHLSELGHEVTVATLWGSSDERADVARLNGTSQVISHQLRRGRKLANCCRALLTAAPLQARYCWLPALAKEIHTRVARGEFDVVHVEHLRGVLYGMWLRARLDNASGSLPFIWDSVDCISHLMSQTARSSFSLRWRLIAGWELARTRRFERQIVEQFRRVLVTSSADKHALETVTGRTADGNQTGQFEILSNGVDVEHFTPNGRPREPTTVVMTGKMSYHANASAALYLVQRVMPHVWQERPDVKLVLAGKDPPREIRALSNYRRPCGQRPSITVTGTVSDIRPYLRQASVAVAPITYGAGLQNKILEAMACGVPVVASARAVTDLATESGRNVLVAEEPESFARHILDIMAIPARGARIGRAGRQFVEQNHCWRRIARQLESVYEEARNYDR